MDEDKFYEFYSCGVFGATIYRKEHKRKVFVARNVSHYYRRRGYLFFESLKEENYGFSVIKDGFSTIKHLGRKFDGHFMVKHEKGYQISFFDNIGQLQIKKYLTPSAFMLFLIIVMIFKFLLNQFICQIKV